MKLAPYVSQLLSEKTIDDVTELELVCSLTLEKLASLKDKDEQTNQLLLEEFLED
eukprot:Awhi_evm1s8026